MLIALPVQYALVGVSSVIGWTEPWPAVVLPGFQGVSDRFEHFEVPRAALEVHFSDSTTDFVPVADVFDPLPASHHLGILRRQFTPATMSGSHETEQALQNEILAWIRSRLERLYPNASPERVDVIWYDTRYSRGGDLLAASPIDTLHLFLR